jgi:ubiquinone/menaquinone biosynthesis C-methylase UbiE
MSPQIDVLQIEACIQKILDADQRNSLCPEFWWYFRSCFSNGSQNLDKRASRRIIQVLLDDFELARIDPRGKTILDAGCGFGISAILMRLMGAQEVHGLDLSDSMIETFSQILKLIPELDRTYPKTGDVCQTNYPAEFFDVVYSNEAISHYMDVTGFIREMHRVLKPGGILFISDANNAANPLIAWRARTIWERFENGPCGNVFYSSVEKPYIEKRREMIREANLDFNESAVTQIAQSTFQFTREQIDHACLEYRQSGKIPNSCFKSGKTPVDPENNNFQENLIHPLALTRELHLAGFHVRVYAYLGGAGGNPSVRFMNRVVIAGSPLTWSLGRAIKVVAIRH